MSELSLARVTRPDDSALAALNELLDRTLADPDTLLGLARLREFVGEANPERTFCVLVARRGDTVVGGSVFSYIVASNCGFSEYIVTSAVERGRGLGRRLFDARKALLDEYAQLYRHDGCFGVFIEVDSPLRTPAAFLDAERTSALDAWERLRIFDHLGFRRVEVTYAQPPLAPGKQAVDYLDLLFAPWGRLGGHVSGAQSSLAGGSSQAIGGVSPQAKGEPDLTHNRIPAEPSLGDAASRSDTGTPPAAAGEGKIPAAWVLDTVAPIWRAWAPLAAEAGLATLRAEIGDRDVALVRAI